MKPTIIWCDVAQVYAEVLAKRTVTYNLQQTHRWWRCYLFHLSAKKVTSEPFSQSFNTTAKVELHIGWGVSQFVQVTKSISPHNPQGAWTASVLRYICFCLKLVDVRAVSRETMLFLWFEATVFFLAWVGLLREVQRGLEDWIWYERPRWQPEDECWW